MRDEQRQPAGRQAAPGSLRLVQAFVNTNDREDGRDELGGPDLVRAWMVDHGLIDPGVTVTADDLERVIAVREAIRALAMANNGWPLDPNAVASLDGLATSTGRLRFAADGRVSLEPVGHGVDAAMFVILSVVHRSVTEGSWPRLKACRRDVCRWLFFDRSRNRSGTWCAMAVCGNRVKTGSYHRRRRQTSAGEAEGVWGHDRRPGSVRTGRPSAASAADRPRLKPALR